MLLLEVISIGLSTSMSLESGENVPLDLGDMGQLTGGGDRTRCVCISDSEYSLLYERVGDIESGDITTEDLSSSGAP